MNKKKMKYMFINIQTGIQSVIKSTSEQLAWKMLEPDDKARSKWTLIGKVVILK